MVKLGFTSDDIRLCRRILRDV
jgi:uridine kinase